MAKREDWQIRKEIKKNGFTGSLAAEVLKKDRGGIKI
jgi:hypothetical protein